MKSRLDDFKELVQYTHVAGYIIKDAWSSMNFQEKTNYFKYIFDNILYDSYLNTSKNLQILLNEHDNVYSWFDTFGFFTGDKRDLFDCIFRINKNVNILEYKPYRKVNENWIGRVLKQSHTENLYSIEGYNHSRNEIFVGGSWFSLETAFNEFYWKDGTPFGETY